MAQRSKLRAILLATTATFSISATEGGAQRPPDPVVPYTPEAAARAVDRFVMAFNAGDSIGLRAAFATSATAYAFDKDNQFGTIDWLPFPWSYHQLQANQLRLEHGIWKVAEHSRARLSALERVVSGSFVVQRERISYQDARGHPRTLDWMAQYQVSNGRILQVWIFPTEELDAPVVRRPRYAPREGPIVWFDAGHGNLDTPEGTYFRFVELLRRDGYTVRTWEGQFTASRLDTIRVLVIVNAMPTDTSSVTAVPIRSAFTPGEVQALETWVAGGGALLLIADHQPMAGAAASLALAFGGEFRDGMARDTTRAGGGGDLFQRSDGTLRPHAITDESLHQSQIDSVVTYLGQAFPPSPEIEPLLVLSGRIVLEEPAHAQRPARRTPVGGWLQGGVREFGRGRVALFGEAWMFRFFERGQNAEFVLNLMNWLGARQ